VSIFREWILKRGVLYALTQTPILAILVGFFLKLAPYPVMYFGVLFAFVALPLWIAHRKSVSTDPDEPVHHLGRYALWALIPVPLFSFVRIPTHFIFGMTYWHPWYDFASALTGLPVNTYATLVPGAILYSLQGYSLVLGFYILFQRHSLLNAILYVTVFDTSIYSFIFPTFARVGMPSPPRWHAVAWTAHLLMSIAVAGMPRFWSTYVPSLSRLARVPVLAACAVVVIMPYAFPAYRAATWQFPTQKRIDLETFSRPNLVRLMGDAKLRTQNAGEATYEIGFEFGPRTYTNYVRRLRALDFKDVEITARLVDAKSGSPLAWCHSLTPELPSANQYGEDDREFFHKLKELDRVRVTVDCKGPSDRKSPAIVVEWQVTAHLVGDRETLVKTFSSRLDTRRAIAKHP
jgi:hypothetical protein